MQNEIDVFKIEFPDGETVVLTKHVNLPLNVNFTNDETLDGGKVVLSELRAANYKKDVSKSFEAFSIVIITFKNSDISYRFCLFSDIVETKDVADGFETFTHTLTLIGEVKKLERYKLDTLTFTAPMNREYSTSLNAEWVEELGGDEFDYQPPTIKMVYDKGATLTISDNISTFNAYGNSAAEVSAATELTQAKITITTPGNNKTVYRSSLNHTQRKGTGTSSGYYYYDYANTTYQISLDYAGEYVIEIELVFLYFGAVSCRNTYSTSIAVNATEVMRPYTISEVIDRLLSITPTRVKGDTQPFYFNSDDTVKYMDAESPEFAFTGHSLFEGLNIIGGYLNGAFPQLNGREISFRPIYNGTTIKEEDLPKPYKVIRTRSGEQYAQALDTDVQNVVAINNSGVGSIVEPYKDGYKTTRAASGSQINEDSAVVVTSYDMYQHQSLEIGKIGDDLSEVGDITPYVYESGEYDSLSDVTASYPFSKAYAVEWTQQGKNYSELAHKVTLSSSSIVNALTRTSLSNIVYVTTGETVGLSLQTYIQSLLGHENKKSFADLPFRTSYTPEFNARIRQYKDYLGDFNEPTTVMYNQSSELVDSEMLGEHLKGKIAQMGNDTWAGLYQFDTVADVPEIGTIVISNGERYCIYNVDSTIYENRVITTLSFVKYAELSDYIGVANAWKDTDVSTDKWYNRFIVYEEFCLISENAQGGNETKFTEEALNRITELNGEGQAATAVMATGYTADGEELNTVILPVISLAIGNSIFWQWKYENALSAGKQSTDAPEGAVNALTGTQYDRAQKDVKYADTFGRIETYNFEIMDTGVVPAVNLDAWDMSAEVYYSYSDKDGVRIYTIQTDEAFDFDIAATYAVDGASYSVTIAAGETSVTISQTGTETSDFEFASVTARMSDKNAAAYAVKEIGYSLPLFPDGAKDNFTPTDILKVDDEIVKKNSSECIIHSVQLHFITDMPDFIIGSGIANFSAMTGNGAAGITIYGFNHYINRFDRRLSTDGATVLSTTLTREVNYLNAYVIFTLPNEINNYMAYAVMGTDSAGNMQVIFAKNRDADGSDFGTSIYFNFRRKIPTAADEDTELLYVATFSDQIKTADYASATPVTAYTAAFDGVLLDSYDSAIPLFDTATATFDGVIEADYISATAADTYTAYFRGLIYLETAEAASVPLVTATFDSVVCDRTYGNASEIELYTATFERGKVVEYTSADEVELYTATFSPEIAPYSDFETAASVPLVSAVFGGTLINSSLDAAESVALYAATFSSASYGEDYDSTAAEIAVYAVTMINDYSSTTIATVYVYENRSVYLSDYTPETPDNYRFLGWFNSSGTQLNSTGYVPTESVTVYAKYAEIAKYTATFVNYDGSILQTVTVYSGGTASYTGSTPTRATTTTKETTTSGNTTTVTTTTTTYTFSGWVPDPTTTTITADTTFTAQFTATTTTSSESTTKTYYTVTITGVSTTQVEAGGTFTFPAYSVSADETYTNIYYASSGGSVTYAAGKTITVNSNLTYHVVREYTVTVKTWLWNRSTNSYGLDGKLYSTQTITVRDDYALSTYFNSSTNVTSVTGYTYYGWHFASTTNGEYPSSTAATSLSSQYASDNTINIFCVLRVNQYTITYYDTDGTSVISTATYNYGTTFNLAAFSMTADDTATYKWKIGNILYAAGYSWTITENVTAVKTAT